jgi:hypothetical protein
MPTTDLLNPVTPILGGAVLSSANAMPVKVISGGGTGITINTSTITGGTTTRLLYDNGGTVGETDGAVTYSSVNAGQLTLTTLQGNSAVNLLISAFASQTINFGTPEGSVALTIFRTLNDIYSPSGATLGANGAFGGLGLSSAAVLGFKSSASVVDVGLTRTAAGSLAVLGSSTAIAGIILASSAVLTGTLTYGTVTFASTVTGSGSLVGGTNPSLSSLVATGTLTYGAVTLASTVTGTGSMVLSASPALTGTASVAAMTHSGLATFSSAMVYGGVTLNSTVTGTGSMVLSAAPSLTGNVTLVSAAATGILTTQNGVAASATGANFALQFSSTASFGVIWGALGSVAPTIAATQGCLYINTSGSSTATRMYVKVSAAGTWTNFTTAA